MCTVLLPPGVNPIAVNKIYQYQYQILKYHVKISALQLKMTELFFHYNEVQNITLRLLFIAVVVVSHVSHGCLTTKRRWT
jgi:hypothetical protein